VIAFGDAGGKQATANITFVPAPTLVSPTAAAAVTASTSAATTAAATGSTSTGATTAASTPSTSSGTLAFTGAGPGLWFILLAGLLLLDLGYLVVTAFYRPREFALRTRNEIRRMFRGE
jgi:hypothetical protein